MLLFTQEINPVLFQNAVREFLANIDKVAKDDVDTLRTKTNEVRISVGDNPSMEIAKKAFEAVGGLNSSDVIASYMDNLPNVFSKITMDKLDIKTLSGYFSFIMSYFLENGSESLIIDVSEGLAPPIFVDMPKTLVEQEAMKKGYMKSVRAITRFFFSTGHIHIPDEFRTEDTPSYSSKGYIDAKTIVENIISIYESRGDKVVSLYKSRKNSGLA